jgi:hypothetical protein
MAALLLSEYVLFHDFGCVVCRALFSPTEMQTISDEFDEAITAARPYGTSEDDEKGFDGTALFTTDRWGWCGRGGRLLGELASDDRIHGPITQLLGEGTCHDWSPTHANPPILYETPADRLYRPQPALHRRW